MAEIAFTTAPRGQVPCTYHPDVQTGLRCTRCGKPICPQCSVRTPVGLRCPDCAGVRGLRTIKTPARALVQAATAALAVGVFVTLLWYVAPDWKFYLSLALGFGVAEAIAWVTHGKRGLDLQLLGIGVVTLAIIAVRVLLAWKYGIDIDQITADAPLLVIENGRIIQGTARNVLQLRIVPDLLFAVMTYAIVWIRFR